MLEDNLREGSGWSFSFDECQMPKVSVIIPTYNRADLVGEAVQSVLAQTLADLELIVVDDGSIDDTTAVLAAFTNPRLRVIRQANQGISGALNTGFAAASGEYAIMLGSDDRFLPSCLSRLVEVADSRPDAVLAHGRAQAIDRQGKLLEQVTGNLEPFPGQILRSILYGDFVSTIAALIRRDALDRVGLFDTTLYGNEDWDMWIRLARHGSFVFVDEVLAQFRIHPTRFTASRGDRMARLLASRVQILDKAFARPDLPSDALAIRPIAYRNVYITGAVRYLNVGAVSPAIRALAQAMRYGDPASTVVRVLYQTLFYRLAPQHSWARVVSDSLFRWRRALRQEKVRSLE